MAQTVYRANLSARTFPFVSKNWGRTVIIQGYDNTFSRQLASTEDPDKDVGIAQAYYMHNVMPHSQGFQSVGYDLQIPAVPYSLTARDIIALQDPDGSLTYCFLGGSLIHVLVSGAWVVKYDFSAANLTSATLEGRTYLYNSGSGIAGSNGCWYYDKTTQQFVSQTLTGLDVDKVLGITSSNGYMIAWSGPSVTYSAAFTMTSAADASALVPGGTRFLVLESATSISNFPLGSAVSSPATGAASTAILVVETGSGMLLLHVAAAPLFTGNTTLSSLSSVTSSNAGFEVYWSSVSSPFDFTPSLVTGAGGGGVELAVGNIIACTPTPVGFNVYTTGNAVAAVYSGDPRFPFNFRPITSSSGVLSPDFIVAGAERDSHLTYTSDGVQLVSPTAAATIFPELTDFLAGEVFEDFDEFTDTMSSVDLIDTMEKSLAIVAGRYMVFSYGLPDPVNGYNTFEKPTLTHALIYDMTSKRWGKLKINHVKCFEFLIAGTSVKETPRQSIAFLQAGGQVSTVNFSRGATNSDGVLILGKYQLARSRMLQLDEVAVEQMTDATCSVLSTPAVGGSTTPVKSALFPLNDIDSAVTYGSSAVGINHSLLFKGRFTLTSLILTFHNHGRR